MAARARRRVLPGLPLSLGWALVWLGLIVLLPLAALTAKAAEVGVSGLLRVLAEERVRAALELSFGLSFAAAALNLVIGVAVAWALTRGRFPGRRVLDAAVDLPFALPTAVAGVALTAVFAPNGWLGAPLSEIGLKVAYTPVGVFVALVFIGLPFVVRTIEPALREVDRAAEEASATLGARRWTTIRRVVLPPLAPAALTGFTLAFARAVGEYGSVIFIAGNLPFVSEIAPLLIVIRLEEHDVAGAAAIACVMLALAFATLLVVNLAQAWSRRRLGHA